MGTSIKFVISGHCSGQTGLTFNLSTLNVQKKEVKKIEFKRKEDGWMERIKVNR
jgi:hypothetical protein